MAGQAVRFRLKLLNGRSFPHFGFVRVVSRRDPLCRLCPAANSLSGVRCRLFLISNRPWPSSGSIYRLLKYTLFGPIFER